MMTTTLCNAVGNDTLFFASLKEVTLEPLLESRPVMTGAREIKMPRSNTRDYTPSEMGTVSKMLELLRTRADVVERVVNRLLPTPVDQDMALDVAIDRLIERLK